MEDSVQLLTRGDMLKALQNTYLQQLIEAEINVEFFKWKEKNLTNGQNLRQVKDNLVNSKRNLETMTQKMKIVNEILKKEPTGKPIENA